MSCKSALYGANTGAQTVAVNSVINFGSIVRRFGCNCGLAGGNVTVNGAGYYDLDANITFEAGAAGTATITLYKDGVEIPGAEVSATVVAGDIYAFSIPTVIRQVCCCEAIITAVLSGVNGTITNAAISVEKI